MNSTRSDERAQNLEKCGIWVVNVGKILEKSSTRSNSAKKKVTRFNLYPKIVNLFGRDKKKTRHICDVIFHGLIGKTVLATNDDWFWSLRVRMHSCVPIRSLPFSNFLKFRFQKTNLKILVLNKPSLFLHLRIREDKRE